MGKSIQFRSFTSDDGDVIKFSSIQFRKCANNYISEQRKDNDKKYTISDFDENVANVLHFSSDTIKNWRLGKNGPGDFQIIKQLADFLKINYHDLLVDKDDKPVTVIDREAFEIEGNNEKDIIMHMYRLFVDYIYWFTGSDGASKAYKLLESPEKEQSDYISNLYYLLDRSALDVSEEIYNDLRKTITELDQVSHAWSRYSLYLPKAWTDVNPFLLKREFYVLVYPSDGDYADYTDSDELIHMFFEDMPDFHNVAKEERHHNPALYDRYESDLLILYDVPIRDDFDFTALVTREYANTLIKLMRKRFPQYFSAS